MLAICASLSTKPGRSLTLRCAAAASLATFACAAAAIEGRAGAAAATGLPVFDGGATATVRGDAVTTLCAGADSSEAVCSFGNEPVWLPACGTAAVIDACTASDCGAIGCGSSNEDCAWPVSAAFAATTGITDEMESSVESCGKRSATIWAAES